MQLTPSTAKGIAQYTGGSRFRLSDLTNPDINIRYGAWYLGHLLAKYRNERLALAAYNAGQENVDSWRKAHEGSSSRRRGTTSTRSSGSRRSTAARTRHSSATDRALLELVALVRQRGEAGLEEVLLGVAPFWKLVGQAR